MGTERKFLWQILNRLFLDYFPLTLEELKAKMITITKKETRKKIKVSREEQGQVIVHCSFISPEDSLIRIWKTTYLICHQSGKKSKLLHAENISVYPLWTKVTGKSKYNFTLIFTALPKVCSSFKLLEEIPENGGFQVDQIQRNQNDVYHVLV